MGKEQVSWTTIGTDKFAYTSDKIQYLYNWMLSGNGNSTEYGKVRQSKFTLKLGVL